LKELGQSVAAGVNPFEIVEVLSGRCKGGKRARNIATKQEQQNNQDDKDNTPDGELAALASHRGFIAVTGSKNERWKV
jgi:hypothetical protein